MAGIGYSTPAIHIACKPAKIKKKDCTEKAKQVPKCTEQTYKNVIKFRKNKDFYERNMI